MELLKRLRSILRIRSGVGRSVYALDESLQEALAERAAQERRPLEQVQSDLLAAGLANLQEAEWLERCWEGLTGREQEVSALACLGYTNRQMAARLGVAPSTVRDYLRQARLKWNVHSKEELRMLLRQWDFSAWGRRDE